VPELAERLLPEARSQRLVAWGGGRVIDTAKAIASVTGGQVCAVPTTLSGAEMTSLHRKIAGRESGPSVRPVLVLADPALMCSLPEPALAMSAMNALAHGVEALYGPRWNPVAEMAALRGAELIADGERALGSLLCAYAVDSAGYGIHHVLCQTAVRVAATGHAATNAAVLPQTLAVMLERAPAAMASLAAAMEVSPADLPDAADRLGGRARIDLTPDLREQVAARALERPELAATPGPPVTRDELMAMLAAASAR
jgi:maleylacetate reductase